LPRRKTFEEWHAEQLARDPAFDRDTDATLRIRGPRRKLDLLIDENLEGVKAELEGVSDFRVHTLPSTAPDQQLWAVARQKRWVLLTADGDFWNDTTYPLHQSPGVIVLVGRTVENHIFVFARLTVVWDLVPMIGRFGPGFLESLKARSSRAGIEWKFFDNGCIVTHNQ